jgi:hypothetical protein
MLSRFVGFFAFCIFLSCGLLSVVAQSGFNEDQNKAFELMCRTRIFRNIVSSRSVCEELVITQRQAKDIANILEQHHRQFEKIVNGMTAEIFELNQQNIAEEVRQSQISVVQKDRSVELENLINGTNDRLKAELLPHQYKRFNQLVNQQVLIEKSRTSSGSPFQWIVSELELSSEDRSAFKEKMDELEKEYQEAKLKLRKQFAEKVVSALPAASRKKITELLGEFLYPER